MKKIFIAALATLQLSCFSSCHDWVSVTMSSDSAISSEDIVNSANNNAYQLTTTTCVQSTESTETFTQGDNSYLSYISDQITELTADSEYQKQSPTGKAAMLEHLLKELQETDYIKEYQIELNCDMPYVAYESKEGERTVIMLSDFKFNKN